MLLFKKLLEKYIVWKMNKVPRMIERFKARFEKSMKRKGISLVAMKDPTNEKNVLLEFVPTKEFDLQQKELKEFLKEEGDKINEAADNN